MGNSKVLAPILLPALCFIVIGAILNNFELLNHPAYAAFFGYLIGLFQWYLFSK